MLFVTSVTSVYRAQTSLLAHSLPAFQPVDHDCMQILYDVHHWVATACVDGEVLVANSLGEAISPTVARQLKAIYGHLVGVDGLLDVCMVPCAQQPNGSDCGVFAAAFLFEWAVMSVPANLNVKFNLPIMRDHLMFCLDRELVIPFPKLPLTTSYKAGTTRTVRI